MTWSPDGAQTVTTGVTGDLVTIVNKASSGTLSSAQLTLASGGQIVWDATANTEEDSQVVTYLAVNTVKEYVRNNIDAAMPKLDEPITANVNIAQNCNAFFDGKAVNFFHSSSMCQNTGLIDDVVFHEFGHALHVAEVIEGVGAFDGAMSEGAAGLPRRQHHGRSRHGPRLLPQSRGRALRQLDPATGEHSWPRDISEIHQTGRIFGGTFWDLRKSLIASLGEGRASRSPTALPRRAAPRRLDPDRAPRGARRPTTTTATWTNGTPHECAIRDAFGRHGLRTATGTLVAPGRHRRQRHRGRDPHRAHRPLHALRRRSDRRGEARVEARRRRLPAPGELNMELLGPGQYRAQLPLAQGGAVFYRANVQFKDGSVLTLPDNLGLPFYQIYQGKTVPLYCTSFEAAIRSPRAGPPAPTIRAACRRGSGARCPAPAAPIRPPRTAGVRVLGMNLGGDYGASSPRS